MASSSFLKGILQRGAGQTARLDDKPASQPIVRDGRRPKVFCIHGFTGVPGEVRLACDVATKLGLATEAPLLRGHGTCPAELAPLRFADWVDGARERLEESTKEGPVILVGLSLGALIATQLTLEVPGHIGGLVLISNAFWLSRPQPDLSLALAGRLRAPDFFIKKSAPDINDPEARASHTCYMEQPLHAAISLREAGKRLRGELFRINCPTLFLHGAQDHVTPVNNAWKAAARLGTNDSRVIVYPRSCHILTRDLEREKVADDLADFFQRIEKISV